MLLSDGKLIVSGDLDDLEGVLDEIGDATEEALQIAANVLRTKLAELGIQAVVKVEV